jgi:phosphonate transport system substrate-binding protein
MPSGFPKIILMLAIFISSFVYFAHATETSKPIQLAILPCENIETTFEKSYPLLKFLIKQTNVDVRLVVPANYSAFETSLRKGEIDFALQDSHTYLMSKDLYNNAELLRVLSMEGETRQSAVVVVRQDSHIKTLSDLRGKTVMFGPESSLTKWVAAKLLFAESGINIDKDLRAYSHGGSCEDIAFSVYLRSVDAGVICQHFLEEHEAKQKELGLEGGQLLVIDRTKSVPTRVFTPRKDVSLDIVSKINNTLLNLEKKNPEHRNILYRMELGGFQRAQTKDYSEVKRLMTRIKAQ